MSSRIFKVTDFSHLLLTQFLQKGHKVVDATAGNGYDTLFLAQTVGTDGLVYAFDIQKTALEKTKELLKKHNCLQQVKFIHDGHENIGKYVHDSLNAIIYNLGYLPGGNKEIITKGHTTLLSVQQGMELLSTGGVIILVAYPGHPGGKEEADLIEDYFRSLSPQEWQSMKWCRLNGNNLQYPYVLCLLKS